MIDYRTLPQECVSWAKLAADVIGHDAVVLTSEYETDFSYPAVMRSNGMYEQYNPFDPDSEDSLEVLKEFLADIKYWKQHIQVTITHPYWPDGHTTMTKMFVKEYTRADVAFAVLEFFVEAHHGWTTSVARGLASPPVINGKK